MGQKCSQIRDARKPDPKLNNANVCTTYNDMATDIINNKSVVGYDPDLPSIHSLVVPGSNNNATNNAEPVASAYIVPADLCLPFLPGRKFNGTVEDYCNNIGDKDANGVPEWKAYKSKDMGTNGAAYAFRGTGGGLPDSTLDNVDSNCLYNDCDEKTSLPHSPACCKLCCAFSGTRVLCERQAYAADPVVCCFLDNSCADENNQNESCFQTTNKRKTCDPRYRDLKSQSCLDEIEPYCKGDKLFAGQSHWLQMWVPDSQVDVNSGDNGGVTTEEADDSTKRVMKQPCLRALARAVYNDSGGVCTWEQFQNLDTFQGVVDPAGLVWAETVLESIFSKYIDEFGSPIGAINQDGYLQSTGFLDFYWNLCKTFPAICQKSLTNFCSNINVEDLLERPEAIKWCGCYMSDDQYTEYEKFSINRECTPYCNMKGNIPIVNEYDFTTNVCTQTTCIIDDVSIRLAEVVNPDGFNFNQLCNSCGGSEISKIFTGINGKSIDDNTLGGDQVIIGGGQDTFSQFIPDKNPEKVKFWYTDVPTGKGASGAIVDSEGHMVVELSVNKGDPAFNPQFQPEPALNDNSFVTLNYTSQTYPDFKGLGSGTLYYITGIKEIIAVGSFKKIDILNPNTEIIYIDSYLNKTYNKGNFPTKIPVDSKGLSNNITKLSTYNRYYSASYDFQVNNWPHIAVDKVNNLKGKNILWNCWSHFTIGYKSNINITSYGSITNNIREDNIQIEANTCSCIIRGSTFDIEDAKIRALNINQHCGSGQCFNKSGNAIACGSNEIDSKIIIDVKNSFIEFEKNLVKDKRELITAVLVVILFIIFLIWISVQYKKPKVVNKKGRTTY